MKIEVPGRSIPTCRFDGINTDLADFKTDLNSDKSE